MELKMNKQEEKKKIKPVDKPLMSLLSRYRKLKMECDELLEQIKSLVSHREETVEGVGIIAKYAKPRRTYNYEQACVGYNIPPKVIKKYSTVSIDWKGVAAEIGVAKEDIDGTAVEADNPSISISIFE